MTMTIVAMIFAMILAIIAISNAVHAWHKNSVNGMFRSVLLIVIAVAILGFVFMAEIFVYELV